MFEKAAIFSALLVLVCFSIFGFKYWQTLNDKEKVTSMIMFQK